MKTTKIVNLDRQQSQTDDTVAGSPIVYVDATIGGMSVLSGSACLIDTGAEHTLIHNRILHAARKFPQHVDKRTIADPILAGVKDLVFRANITIQGMDEVEVLVTGSDRPERHPMLIGRDLLKHYRLVYDPPAKEFTLSKR